MTTDLLRPDLGMETAYATGRKEPGRDEFNGVAIDENDQPTFDSEAAYLKRLRLLMLGEERRFPKANWKPNSERWWD